MKTMFAKTGEVERKWLVIDAKDQVLGRMATRIAMCLRGKNKTIFTPHVDAGDFVIVVNADKVKVTGNKLNEKAYYRHSEYRGGLRETLLKDRMSKEPENVIRDAVWGMLPKNRLGRALIKKLKVYRGPDHRHAAQKPEPLQTLK